MLPDAAATTYTVTANPYSRSDTISIQELWDAYELTAANGARVTYSVTASGGGCVMLLFAKGHGITMSSTYYVAYSQESCVSSYSTTFPVGSNDGTDFTVIIATTSSMDVPYTVNVNVQSPGALDTALIILVVVAVIGGPVIVGLLLRRRKAARTPPPMVMPPAYQTPYPMPPGYPPQQPPEQPPTPPVTPP